LRILKQTNIVASRKGGCMKIFLLKNVPNIGKAGNVYNVTDGFARNFLIPRKLGIEVTAQNESNLSNLIKVAQEKKETTVVKTSQLAERIKALELVLKRRMHDDGKLYGSLSASEIVDLLADQGVSISKSQVILDKSIKSKGTYTITIQLSQQLNPTVKLKIVPEEQKA
jgi:large subunit ribosomal protein L9